MSDIDILRLSYEKPGVFGELFDRHQSRFLKIALSNLASKEKSEDVVQNAFVRIYKYGKNFILQGGDFKLWSDKILYNCIIDEAKKTRLQVKLSEEIESLLEAPSEFPEYESNNFLNSVFDKLDFISRDILKMRFVFGKSFKYIGRTLGISSGAARVRAHRAKKMFVETYKQMS